MIPTRPYLLRAIYQWAMDNNLTPQLLVNTRYPGVLLPQNHINDGHIVLNVQERAVKGLVMENDFVSFSARFSGQSHYIELPINSIEAIYTRETEKGMFFQPEEEPSHLSKVDDDSNVDVNTGSSVSKQAPKKLAKKEKAVEPTSQSQLDDLDKENTPKEASSNKNKSSNKISRDVSDKSSIKTPKSPTKKPAKNQGKKTAKKKDSDGSHLKLIK